MSAQEKLFALGRLKTGEMNKTELAYARHLEMRKRAGEVLWYKFECLKLRLGDNLFYSPDFLVMLADQTLEVHEVKGYWQEDAKVKIKAAAHLYPILRFVAVFKQTKKAGGGWDVVEF